MEALQREPITANESEKPALRKIEGVLNSTHHIPEIVGPDGIAIELPVSVLHLLRHIIYDMMNGKAISIISISKELTTQEAADILNVSRPYLIKLLERGKIPYSKVGSHRRIRFSDLMNYKKFRDEARRQGLAEMAHISEDAGLYD